MIVRRLQMFARRQWPEWRHWLERTTFDRHPVSLARQRAGRVLLVVLGLGALWYGLTTRDESIRRRAVEYLTEATVGEVQVERASFRMFGGITLHNVRVSVPYSEQLDPTAISPRDREIFSATALRLVHNPWRLLLGDLRVERILAVQPRIVLAQNVETGVRNWQLLSRVQKPGGGDGPRHRPQIMIRSAVAEVVSVRLDGRRERQEIELDADIRPHRQLATAYSIDVRRYAEPVERTTVVFDPGARLVTNTPFVEVETVRLQLPEPVQEFFRTIALEGQVKVSRLLYDARSPEDRDTAIELREVRCRMPLSMLSSPAAEVAVEEEEEEGVRLTGISGRFDLRGNHLDLDITGLVNGARCIVSGSLDGVDRPVNQIGVNLHVVATAVPAPEGKLRERLEHDERLPWSLRQFFHDYDPRGPFGCDLYVRRPAGGAGQLSVVGVLEPQDASASHRLFPYRVTDLRGRVVFRPESVHLEDVVGRHGSAAILVNGVIDRRTCYASADVDIRGADVPLDDDLFRPLASAYQDVWRRFNPSGTAEIAVHVVRPGAGPDDPRPEFRTTVRAELTDAAICFREYPYPLEKVRGRLDISGGRIQFHELVGRRGDGVVRISGFTQLDPPDRPQVEMRIDAESLRIDEVLARALPAEGRAVIEQFQPEGVVDLSGTIRLGEAEAGLRYDLKAVLREASLCYRQFPYRLGDVRAEVEIRPEAISVLRAAGRHSGGEVVAGGRVERRPEGLVADLTLECRGLALDAALFEALPPPLVEVWRLLEPSGRLNARTALHYSTAAGGELFRHRTEVELADGRLCFRDFPLPLREVSAGALVTDQRVEIQRLRGLAGAAGEIELRGELTLGGEGREGTLFVEARDLSLDEGLFAALPPRLRGWAERVLPAGRFSMRLDPLSWRVAGGGSPQWSFNGEVHLDGVRAMVGVELREAAGVLRGHGGVNSDGGVELSATADLERITVAGWKLDRTTARVSADPAARTVSVEDIAAELYGGEATGFARVRTRNQHTAYEASISARDLELSRYVAAHSRVRGDRLPSGTVYGNLALRGRTGRQSFREGAGEVFIREAQIARVPIMLMIFQVLNLAPDENAFHDGWIRYSLSGGELRLQPIDLQGSALSFLGAGTLDLGSRRLDVTLVAGSPVRLRVPVLTELVEGASRELMEVRVTGTLENPRITPQPFRSLNEAMKGLLPEAPGRGSRE